MLGKALMTYGGRHLLGKHVSCHLAHATVDKLCTRHDNIHKLLEWYLWPEEPSAWSMFLVFYTGFGA